MSEHDDLVEPEGVNASSADATAEAGPEPHADVRAGGAPGRAPRIPEEADPAPEEELAGAPGTEAPDPGQHAAPPGQDSGSAS